MSTARKRSFCEQCKRFTAQNPAVVNRTAASPEHEGWHHCRDGFRQPVRADAPPTAHQLNALADRFNAR